MRNDLAAIVAVCDDWGIGRDGDMVVANKADMRHFVAHTSGCTVVMGRRTLESFPGSRPLKNRRNIVLTRDASFMREGAEVAHSVPEALAMLAPDERAWVVGGGEVYRQLLALAMLAPDERAWVVGGGEVYRQLLPYCTRAVVTKNHCVRPADAYFPNLDDDPAWHVAAADGPYVVAPGEGDAGVPFEFVTYERAGADEKGLS